MMIDDVLFLATALVLAVIVTGVTFFTLRALKVRKDISGILSALMFPTLLIAIIVFVEVRGADPHHVVMVVFGLTAIVSLPVTSLTTMLLNRRFAQSP